MNAYGTKLAEAFAAQTIEKFFAMSVADAITNSEYEGQIKDKTSVLNVLTFGQISEHNYTGADMVADSLTESNTQLVTDQQKYIYFTVKDIDVFKSYVKNPQAPVQRQIANRIKQVIDIYVLGFYADAHAGNVDGTNYSTGTVTVDVTTGLVTGSGTTFTAGMVGKGFKATGHTKAYRIKTFTNTTSIVIEDDSDDLSSAYTGGAIEAGATYVINAVSAVQVTTSNIFARVSALATMLTNNEIPDEDRFLVLPASIAALVRQIPEYASGYTEGGRQAVQNGLLPKKLAGFDLYEVPDARATGNVTDGFHCLGGHKSAICFAMGLTKNGIEDAMANFGTRYKALWVYGAKVADERRIALVDGYWKL